MRAVLWLSDHRSSLSAGSQLEMTQQQTNRSGKRPPAGPWVTSIWTAAKAPAPGGRAEWGFSRQDDKIAHHEERDTAGVPGMSDWITRPHRARTRALITRFGAVMTGLEPVMDGAFLLVTELTHDSIHCRIQVILTETSLRTVIRSSPPHCLLTSQ